MINGENYRECGGWRNIAGCGEICLDKCSEDQQMACARQQFLDKGFQPKICTHNQMVANDDPIYSWKCANCGYIYGKEKTLNS